MSMKPEILIVAEHDGAELDPLTFDLISCGSQIASEKSWKLGLLVLGFKLDGLLEKIRGSGVDVIFTIDDARLQEYNSCIHLEIIAHAVRETRPHLLLLGHSYFGIEIGSGLAPKLDTLLVSNCQSIKVTSGGFVVTRPMFGGMFLASLEIEATAPVLVSIQKGSSVFKGPLIEASEIIRLAASAESNTAKIKVTRETKAAFGEDIAKADIVVAIGRGIGQESRVSLFRELAQALGGVIAASRPIVDMGWLPVDYQVGLSGRTVKPKVYLAWGISGSAQHIDGMKDSGLIIAINKDPSAPIFQVAHYGVVGDLFEIVPPLLEIAKEQSKG